MVTIIFDKLGALPKGTLPTKWALIIEQSDFSRELFIFGNRWLQRPLKKRAAWTGPRFGIPLPPPISDDRDGSGEIRVEHTRLNAIRPVIQWQNGSMELVWPDNQKSKAFVYPITGSK